MRHTDFSSFLVPVDFSDCSRRAFESAVELAKRCSARLIVLHAVQIPEILPEVAPITAGNPDQEKVKARATEAAHRSMDLLLESAGVEGHVETIFTHRPAVESILNTAEERGVGLIVMGTHGRTGLSRLVLGSVAEQVVRRAPCPVLTVGPDRSAEGGETGP
jgi:nucleotide-binding universal stress UspA family protein